MSANAARAVWLRRSPSSVRGLWIPGVSQSTACTPGRVRTPRTSVLVVWGLSDTMVTFWPSSRFISVDLPTFGRPTSVTNPEQWPSPDTMLELNGRPSGRRSERG